MIERSSVEVSASSSPEGWTSLTMMGVLDGTTYHEVRNSVIKAALEEPSSVIVDVSGLDAPAASAWAAFTSARWYVSTWPDIPVLLVCVPTARRAEIQRSGVTRYVPVYPDRITAVQAVGESSTLRRRAGANLVAGERDSLRLTREKVAEWLTVWGREELTNTTATVASIFVENVFQHTMSHPALVLESTADLVTVAVSDHDPKPAARTEDPTSGAHPVSGLAIVGALSRVWGCTPTTTGKTVWALLGPENQI